MRKTLLLLATPLFIVLLFAACSKNNPDAVYTCSNDFNFCVEIDGQEREGNATMSQITPSHYKMEWKSSTSDERIVMDMYGQTRGTYLVLTNAQEKAGVALFYINNGETSFGASGAVDIMELSKSDAQGTLEAIAIHGTNGQVISLSGSFNTYFTPYGG